jgi:hypothetical protein
LATSLRELANANTQEGQEYTATAEQNHYFETPFVGVYLFN